MATRLTILACILLLFLALVGCSTADNQTAKFKQAQKLRQQALTAARQGDTASALAAINRVQLLQPLESRTPGLTPPSMHGPRHRAIAPAGGQVTCNNTGINRFYCF